MAKEDRTGFTSYEIDQVGRKGEVQDAFGLALDAIRVGACDDELFFVAASLAYRLGDLDKAGQLVNMLLARDPDHVNGWVLFGQIHEDRSDAVRAEFGRASAQSLFPAVGGDENSSLELTDESGGDERAPEGLADEEEISFDTMTFAEICTRQGYYNKALKIYHDLQKKRPHDSELKRRIEDLTKRLK
jgi:tetratricopeptide (TPR) repeat protein